MKLYVNFQMNDEEKTNELRKQSNNSNVIFCATELGCCDDEYATTEEEINEIAAEMKEPIISKLVYNPNEDEYEAVEE